MMDDRPLGRSHFEISLKAYTLSFRRVEYYTFDYEKISNGMHYHDCYEMVYVMSGEAVFRTGRDEQILGPGSLYLADPGEPHEIHIKKGKHMSLLYFVFTVRQKERHPAFLNHEEKTLSLFLKHHEKTVTRINALGAYTSFFREYESLGGDRKSIWFQKTAENFVFTCLESLCTQKPEQDTRSTADESLLEKALDMIDKNMSGKISAEDLAVQISTSRRHLYRLFRTHLNQTVHGYIKERKIRLAETYLAMNYSVSETARLIGMESLPAFSRMFRQYSGMTPRQYKNLCFDGTSGYGSGIRI